MQREAELWDTTEKRTVRRTDGLSVEHIDPNIHNIDTDVGIVFISSTVMRFLLLDLYPFTLFVNKDFTVFKIVQLLSCSFSYHNIFLPYMTLKHKKNNKSQEY